MSELSIDHDTVLVGIDGTTAGWAALSWAAHQTARQAGRLAVCLVQPADPDQRGDGQIIEAEQLLARATTLAEPQLSIEDIFPLLRHGDIVDALTRTGASARMLVIGAAGPISWSEQVTGSVVVGVAARARCPVVVVRPPDPSTTGPFAGHVVVCVDDSTAVTSALEFAFEYAAAHRIPLAAVHAASGRPDDYWFDENMLDTRFSTEPQPLALLAERTESWQHKYPGVAVKLAVFGSPAVTGLLRAARGARILVIGNRDTHPEHDPLGPVALGILTRAGCPVAVLRCDE